MSGAVRSRERHATPSVGAVVQRVAVLLACGLSPACRGEGGSAPSGEAAGRATLALETLGEPTARQGSLDLDRELTIDGEFGGVVSLAVDRAGRMYVADYLSQDIKVFAPDGRARAPLGRRGRGPGEYEGIVSLVAGRGDTLFAFDAGLQRITAYDLQDPRRVSYTLSVPGDGTGRASYDLLVPSRDGFLLQFSVPYNPRGTDSTRYITVRALDRLGRIRGDAVLQVRDRQALVTRLPGDRVNVGPLPYGRESFLRLGPEDRLYSGWSDSLFVTVHDPGGNPIGTVSGPMKRAPVRRADIDRLIASYDAGTTGRAVVEAAARNRQLPATKPAYRALVVDESGHLWINVVQPHDVVVNGGRGLTYASGQPEDDASPWWVLDSAGRRLGDVSLPFGVNLQVIRGNRAYGIETDSLGVERVVRYAVGREAR